MVAVEVQSSALDSSLMDLRVDPRHASECEASFHENDVSQARDTSQASRGALDNSRVTVNTHNSILNITEDEDDDDEDGLPEKSFLFEDMHSHPVDEDLRAKDICCDYALSQPSVLDQVTERFLDGICGPHDVSQSYRGLEIDILELLGCLTHPDEDELRWNTNSVLCHYNSTAPSPQRPQRKNLKQRAMILHRMRQERKLPLSHTGLSPTSVAPRTRSLDERARFLHLTSGEEGYDSDPEHTSFTKTVTPSRSVRATILHDLNDDSTAPSIPTLVQETLNLIWTLTYHAANTAPTVCRVWMERGTLVNQNSTMLEPNLMWRPAIHEKTIFERAPQTIRLLNICRVVPADLCPLNRSKFPLARASCSFWVRTADHEDFLFQANSNEERNIVMLRWKHCIARFATLAVMEDMDAIAREFFMPTEYSH